MSISLYGIANCDSCRKARKWLKAQGIEHHWHDLRKDGLTAARVRAWLDALGADTLLNRRGQSWRRLDEEARTRLEAGEVALFLEQPTVIKRPVLDRDGAIRVGFDADTWATLFET